jgi:hypothetical protein
LAGIEDGAGGAQMAEHDVLERQLFDVEAEPGGVEHVVGHSAQQVAKLQLGVDLSGCQVPAGGDGQAFFDGDGWLFVLPAGRQR